MVFWMGIVTLAAMVFGVQNAAAQQRLAALLALVMWAGFGALWFLYVFRGAA